MSAKTYVLTKSVRTRLTTMGFPVTCRRCGKALEVGDTVVSRSARPGGRTVRYHIKCYEELFAS